MEAASHSAFAGIARYLNRRAQSKRSEGPQALSQEALLQEVLLQEVLLQEALSQEALLQMSLKSPSSEDLYLAQIKGRSSVLRRGLAAHFSADWRGLPKVGETS